MPTISRDVFVTTMLTEQGNAGVDVGGLDARTQAALAHAGLDPGQLRDIAGDDGVISTRAEYDRLFALIDTLDRNGDRHSVQTTRTAADGTVRPTSAGVVVAALVDELERNRLSARTANATPDVGRPASRPESAPWLEIARGELGQREIKGDAHNPRILEYHQSVRGKITSDETPWCSSFVNWAMEKAGIRGTDSARPFVAEVGTRASGARCGRGRGHRLGWWQGTRGVRGGPQRESHRAGGRQPGQRGEVLDVSPGSDCGVSRTSGVSGGGVRLLLARHRHSREGGKFGINSVASRTKGSPCAYPNSWGCCPS